MPPPEVEVGVGVGVVPLVGVGVGVVPLVGVGVGVVPVPLPLVKDFQALIKAYVLCETPLQLSLAVVEPAQLPLSRETDQKASSPTWFC